VRIRDLVSDLLLSFCEQKAAYEFGTGDWSSDVCTSSLYQVLDFWFPNDMGFFAKLGHYFVQLGKFVADDPREANTEGGVFPAIFGTVFMVM